MLCFSAIGALYVGREFIYRKLKFEGGRAKLELLGVPIESLVIITDMSDGEIVFAE